MSRPQNKTARNALVARRMYSSARPSPRVDGLIVCAARLGFFVWSNFVRTVAGFYVRRCTDALNWTRECITGFTETGFTMWSCSLYVCLQWFRANRLVVQVRNPHLGITKLIVTTPYTKQESDIQHSIICLHWEMAAGLCHRHVWVRSRLKSDECDSSKSAMFSMCSIRFPGKCSRNNCS